MNPIGIKQISPHRNIIFYWHLVNKVSRFIEVSNMTKKIDHATIMIYPRGDVKVFNHAMEVFPSLMHPTNMETC